MAAAGKRYGSMQLGDILTVSQTLPNVSARRKFKQEIPTEKVENAEFEGPIMPFDILLTLIAPYLDFREYLSFRSACHQLKDNLPRPPSLPVVQYIDAYKILCKWLCMSRTDPSQYSILRFNINPKDLYKSKSNCLSYLDFLRRSSDDERLGKVVYGPIPVDLVRNILDCVDTEIEQFQAFFIKACEYENSLVVKHCLAIPRSSPHYIKNDSFWSGLKVYPGHPAAIELFFSYKQRCREVFEDDVRVLAFIDEYSAIKINGPGLEGFKIIIRDFVGVDLAHECFMKALENSDFDHLEIFLDDPRIDPTRNDNEAMRIALENTCMKNVLLLLKDGRIDASFDDNIIFKSLPDYFSGELVVEDMNLLPDILTILLHRVEPHRQSCISIVNSIHSSVEIAGWMNYSSEQMLRLILDDSRILRIDCNTLLRTACNNGDIEMVKLLLSYDQVNPSAMENEPIKIAGARGELEIVTYLMKHPRFRKESIEEFRQAPV